MVTIFGIPNSCQVVSVISQAAMNERAIENPFTLAQKAVAVNSSVAPIANDNGLSSMTAGPAESKLR
jgi:hypothetical protein